MNSCKSGLLQEGLSKTSIQANKVEADLVCLKTGHHTVMMPKDLLLEIFSYFLPSELTALTLTGKKFYRICQSNVLWKPLLKNNFSESLPAILSSYPQSNIDFKAHYQNERYWEKKSITFIRKFACSFFQKNHRFSPLPKSCFLAFNKEGRLKAISCSRQPLVLKDSLGSEHQILREDWKASLSVYSQFVHLATLDGHHPIQTNIVFKLHTEQLALLEAKRIECLNTKINQWIKASSQSTDLDNQVKQALSNHYTALEKIQGIRDGEMLITPEVKAYFVFFRGLTGCCRYINQPGVLLEDNAETIKPLFTPHVSIA